MANAWPWLALASAGALHGLNPASGWLLSAVWGARSRDRAQALRALVPIGVGHVASISLVVGAVAVGVSIDRGALLAVAGALLLVAAAVHLACRAAPRASAPAGCAALALGSFWLSTAHGAGLMLVPALVPLCAADAMAGRVGSSGPVMVAIAAAGVHAAAMPIMSAIVSLAVGDAMARRHARTVSPSCRAERHLISRTSSESRQSSGCPAAGASTRWGSRETGR